MNYNAFYGRISQALSPYKPLLNGLNTVITAINYLAYVGLLVMTVFQKGWQGLVWTVVITGGGFVLLSLGRSRLNRQRPYERWGISPLLDKDSSGKSMPSRHVFSAALIGMLGLSCHIWLGGLILGLAACLALLRVLGGVHYPSDVLVGYILGILVGSLLFLV